MEYGLWIAVLGAITGVASLALHFRSHLEERPRLIVQFPEGERGRVTVGYFVDPVRSDAHGGALIDRTRFTVFLWVRLLNRSDKPTALFEVTLSMRQHPIYTFDSGFMGPEWAEIVDGDRRGFHGQVLKPVLEVKPYSTVEGYLVFGPLGEAPENGAKATVTFGTTRAECRVRTRIRLADSAPQTQKDGHHTADDRDQGQGKG